MSLLNTSVNKQPLKLLEIPLNKFSEEVIPHHQKIFEQHKSIVMKLISQNKTEQLQMEARNRKRTVKQIKDLMYELDTLRTQVENADLDKFDQKTLFLRKILLNLITGYSDLEDKTKGALSKWQDPVDTATHPFNNVTQIQMHENLDNLKLKQQQQILNDVENIQRDTEDLHEIFTQLDSMVGLQRQQVEEVEEHVEETQQNVQSGLKHLIKTNKMKSAAYPITGALIGTVIGGPIGLIAGLKVGGLTAIGCAIAGYTGGRFFKKSQEVTQVTTEVGAEERSSNDSTEDGKKDI